MSEVQRLLDLAVKEASASMAAEPGKQLYGIPVVTSPDVPEGTMYAMNSKTMSQFPTGPYWALPVKLESAPLTMSSTFIENTYRKSLEDNIFKSSTILEHLKTQPKETTVSGKEIINKVMKERKEVRADQVITNLAESFDNMDIEPGSTVVWMTQFADSDKDYHYAAVYSGNRWYITARETSYTTENLIAEIAELALRGEVWFEGSDEPL
jgi:hypothetical protein